MKLIKPKKPPPPILNLRVFHEKRNKVLVLRELGGLGDILMHRMMFEDFKKTHSELEIVFACPPKYHAAVLDHPYIDEVLDSRVVNPYDYTVSYNTTTACTRYEMRVAPYADEHRSDIWAGHCGVKLNNHNMHINLAPDIKDRGASMIKSINPEGKPCVLLASVSAMTGKNLTDNQTKHTVKTLRDRGLFVCSAHTMDIPIFKELGVPVFHSIDISTWMGLLNSVDYIISVDTAAFHYGGGIGKPLLGIFTFADGKVYGKYFKHELVQKHRDNGDWACGPCYNWPSCPKSKNMPKPCLTEITPQMLEDGIDRLLKRWPPNTVQIEWNNTIL